MNAKHIPSILAPKHTGMMVEGLRVLRRSFAGSHFMRKEMADHLEEVARRFYAGKVSIVDEFLQLYRIGTKHRDDRVQLEQDGGVETEWDAMNEAIIHARNYIESDRKEKREWKGWTLDEFDAACERLDKIRAERTKA